MFSASANLTARRFASTRFFRSARAAASRGCRGVRLTAPRARLDVECRPESYSEELAEKIAIARSHFDDVCALPTQTETHESARTEFRMRAEFKVWHDGDRSYYAMSDSDRPKEPVEIADFPMASKKIRELMPALLREVTKTETLRRKLFQANFLTTTTGDAVVSLLYHRQLDDNWEREAEAMRARLGIDIIGRARKQKKVLAKDFVTEKVVVDGREFSYKQLEGSFTQPNAGIAAQMLEWARSVATNDSPDGEGSVDVSTRDLLELYCGNGHFTIALAPLFRKCLATEISKSSVAAAQVNMAANGVDNLVIARLSAEELSDALNGGREYTRLKDINLASYDLSTILVDPPRAGMGDEVSTFCAQFERIIYISCNPETLARDCRVLSKTHDVKRFAVFDQFPYTPHLESGVLLKKR
ncbi:tRNA (uracil(54)-C(5))-methyltransferase,TrmA,proteobacteria [Ostreococcus tauri]|uniref:Methyltransferase family protein n=1 Tax=Ostreococcus tauri TaxID=70448 RepID=Q01CP3_OSTTA|nr:tRNA (uracil(54)-C(5))-methyltransferase,TrmA,proteobacteria [Ostreococcus tauri]OUS43863.1 methyltransferase family protein [Ostreococcus tauri]CAL52910.1 tRNA (uracil(54)-C(5))-methyltransferase,TrmA,proteobacteria [Ostreococcus tauri]|eukprot:XP_003078170.1 tRNA (uracil(54)-C(5))-methyltransferase,TrmA,proteobacteria [Ostreococcus tauri]